MADEDKKRLINRVLKQIFEKSQETLGFQNLEKLIKKNYKGDNQKEKEESLANFSKLIISEMLDSQFKKYIIHGDMSIFYSLFCTYKSLGVNNEYSLFMGLLDPLFDFFQKKDAKVVCSSVNVVIKIIRGNKYFMLKNFNKIFKNLMILILRKEIEIRNCGYFLDEIMKNDFGTIFQDSNYSENDEEIKSILDNLIEMLGEDINCPAKNILIVSWLDFFENIPQMNLTNLTNNYILLIPKLFKMLCSKVKEEISSSEFCLKKIINNIEILYEDLINKNSEIINKILEIIINNCDNEFNEQIQKCSFELLEVFLKKFKKIVMEYNDLGEKLDIIDEKNNASPFSKNIDSSFYNDSFEEKKNQDENKNDKKCDFKYNNNNCNFKLNNKYIEDVNNKDQEKIKLLMDNIPLKLFPDILSVIIHNSIINSNNPIIYEPINKCNTTFRKLITMIKSEYFKKNEQKLSDCFERVIDYYINSHDSQINEISTNLIFDWIFQLYKIHLFKDEEYLKHLFFVVPEINELIIKRILGILNEISSNNYNDSIIEIIIKKFIDCPQMINTYGILILKELLKTFNIKILFEKITNILLYNNNNDIYFIMRMIYLLNKFLIIEEEANDIRNLLIKVGSQGKNKEFFDKLFNLWSFNPFCTLILVLLSNCFELGYALIMEISEMELKTEDYIELEQVVQVFESSIFNNVRIKLLNPYKYSYLIKTLYAILLLLPQGQAFDALTTRLRCLEIIFSLDDENEEKEEEDFIYCYNNEYESSEEHKLINFSPKSSNSISSNFELSNKSFNDTQNENILKFSVFQSKKDVYFSNKAKEEQNFEKKGVQKYIDIFNKNQKLKRDFDKERSQQNNKQNYCNSPSFYVKINYK